MATFGSSKRAGQPRFASSFLMQRQHLVGEQKGQSCCRLPLVSTVPTYPRGDSRCELDNVDVRETRSGLATMLVALCLCVVADVKLLDGGEAIVSDLRVWLWLVATYLTIRERVQARKAKGTTATWFAENKGTLRIPMTILGPPIREQKRLD